MTQWIDHHGCQTLKEKLLDQSNKIMTFCRSNERFVKNFLNLRNASQNMENFKFSYSWLNLDTIFILHLSFSLPPGAARQSNRPNQGRDTDIRTTWRAERYGVPFPSQARNVLFSKISMPTPEYTKPPMQWASGREFPRGKSGRDMIFTTNLHVMPRLRISAAI
jgi:hypothetical protein